MKPFGKLLEQSNQSGIDFLWTEIDAAHTFLDVARTTGNKETALRNRDNAQSAYESIMRFKGRVHQEVAEKADFDARVAKVKIRLVEAGCLI